MVKVRIGKHDECVRQNTHVYIPARPPRPPRDSEFANSIRAGMQRKFRSSSKGVPPAQENEDNQSREARPFYG